MRIKALQLIKISSLLISLSACSTIVSGTQQSMFIETPKVMGAECKLNDSKGGGWYLNNTPGSVTVTKGNGPMNIVCSKKGYETTSVSVEETVAGATFGNIILGGGIGIFVDAASGAAQIYPDKVVVWMKPTSWKSSKEEQDWQKEKISYEEEQAKKEAALKEQTKSTNKDFN